VADVDAVLDLDLHRHPQANEFDTIGGLVMTVLGRLPVMGDVVHYGGCRIAVERMDGRRVGLVRVRLSQRPTRP
jgi:CBS domain containing-hemolysin-like protein